MVEHRDRTHSLIMELSALIPLALQILPLITTGVPEFIAWIEKLRSTAQQTGEWTDAQEQAYRAALWAKTQDPAYAPDAD